MIKEGVTRRSRWQAAIVFVLPFLLFGLAWFMYFSGQWVPEGRTNKGTLLLPPSQFDDLVSLENNPSFSPDLLSGRWAIIVFGDAACANPSCQNSLYITRQVHLGLAKEANRVTRLLISKNKSLVSEAVKRKHPDVFWLQAKPETVEKALSVSTWPEGQYFIMDPLGNIMMNYQPEQQGNDLLRDMQKLLRASNIG